MGNLILCRSERAKTPYYIENGKLNIYSLEELMYYAQTSGFVAGEDFLKPEFVRWVDEELDLPKLAKALEEKLSEGCGLVDFFLPIESVNGYLTPSELQILNVKLQKYDHMSGLEAKKQYADHIFAGNDFVRAIHAYRMLLNDESCLEKQGYVAGDIWSNLGCAYARLFDYEEAFLCFVRGFSLNHRHETLRQAVDAAVLSGKENLLAELSSRFMSHANQIATEREQMEQLLKKEIYECRLTEPVGKLLVNWNEKYLMECDG